MKKEPIIYFPQDVKPSEKRLLAVGSFAQIGKPSSRYYEHIYHSLNHNAHQLSDLQALLKLEGITVKVTSILKMKTGDKIAVLHKKEGGNFLANIEKLFANLDKALETKELKFY